MKRPFALFVACLLALTLIGCKKESPQEYLDLGAKYLSEGNYEQAIIAFDAALRIDPKSVPALEGRGDAYVGLGYCVSAIESYSVAIELDNKNAELYEKLGAAYEKNGEAEKAKEAYQRGYEVTEDEHFIADEAPLIDETSVREFMDAKEYFFHSDVSLQRPEDISEFDILYEAYFFWYYQGWAGVFKAANSAEVSEVAQKQLNVDGMLMDGRVNNINIDVCDNNTLQQRLDDIFGVGHSDVRSVNGEGRNPIMIQLSNDKTAIVGWGYGGAGGKGARYEIRSIDIDGGVAVVNAYCVYYGMSDDGSFGALYDADGSLLKEDNLRHSFSSSFGEIIDSNGIDRSQLKPIDYVFYMTAEGVRFWGAGASGTVSTPSVDMIAPAQPLSPPEAVGTETIRTVSANGGLRMREGPGTSYGIILLIPDGSQVRSYDEQDGWYYVNYQGKYGWVSGDYCS